MSNAHGQEVVEVGATTMAPPSDVMNLAVVEPHGTVRDRAPRVDRSQRSSLRDVREPCGAAEVETAGRMDDRSVAHDDRVHVGPGHEVGQDPNRQLDGDAPIDVRLRADVGVAGVDDHDDFGSRTAGSSTFAQVEQRDAVACR